MEIVSQELVPASQALAVRTPETGASTGNKFKGEQSPNTPVSNGPRKDMKDAQSSRVEAVRSDGMTSPKGPPVSHGPPSFVTPEGHRQSMPPPFTPEQSARLNEIHRPALLGVPPRRNPAQGELGYGGGDRSALQNMFGTFLHSFGQMSPDLTGRMQRGEAWELQVEQTIDQLGVQLRASQSENHRLRQERQELREALERKGHSRCGTPEERSSVSFAKEGSSGSARTSTKGGRGRVPARASFQGGRSSGSARFFAKRREDRAETQEERNMQDSASDQSSEEPQTRRGKEKTDQQTVKVMLKSMQGMQELQKQIVVSKDEGKGEEIETLRFAAELPKLILRRCRSILRTGWCASMPTCQICAPPVKSGGI